MCASCLGGGLSWDARQDREGTEFPALVCSKSCEQEFLSFKTTAVREQEFLAFKRTAVREQEFLAFKRTAVREQEFLAFKRTAVREQEFLAFKRMAVREQEFLSFKRTAVRCRCRDACGQRGPAGLLQEMFGGDNQLQMLIPRDSTIISRTLAVRCNNVKCLCVCVCFVKISCSNLWLLCCRDVQADGRLPLRDGRQRGGGARLQLPEQSEDQAADVLDGRASRPADACQPLWGSGWRSLTTTPPSPSS